MRDYSKYEKTPVLFSGAEKKFEIIIDGFRYIVKFQKNSEVGLTFNYVSEYLGSHIFQLIGIPVSKNDKNHCRCTSTRARMPIVPYEVDQWFLR